MSKEGGISGRRFSVRAVLLCVLACSIAISCGGECIAREPIGISGITEPISDVTLSLSVPGIVSTISVKEGDRLRKGQRILHLDKRTEELEVARRKLVWESKSEYEGAQARARTLKEIYDATLMLFKSTKSVSEEELKKQELELRLAVAERDRLAAAEKREKIEYEIAVETLEKRNLRSPIDGTVITLFYDEGESFEEHQPLVRVVDTGRGRFVSNLEENIGRFLKVGQQVDLVIGTGGTSVRKKGTISFVSPLVDSASGLMEVKVEFENMDNAVRPGTAATMEVDLKSE